MSGRYRVIRVKEDIYIKIKAFQLELLRRGSDKTPSMSETLEALITKNAGRQNDRKHLQASEAAPG